MKLFVLAQIFGVFGALSMVLSSWQKTRKKILFFLIFDNVFYFIQYILLGAFSGAFTNVVGLIRIFSFRKKGENKFFKTNWILYIVLILYTVTGILTYDGISSLFPIIASLLYSIVLWQDKPKSIRLGTSLMLFMWFVYNLSVKAYVGVISEGILFISSVMAIIRIDFLKGKKSFKKEFKDFIKFKNNFDYKKLCIREKNDKLYCKNILLKDSNGYIDKSNKWLNINYNSDNNYSKMLSNLFKYDFKFKGYKISSVESFFEGLKCKDRKLQKKIFSYSGDELLKVKSFYNLKNNNVIWFDGKKIEVGSKKYHKLIDEFYISAIRNPIYRNVIEKCDLPILYAKYDEDKENNIISRNEIEYMLNCLHEFLNQENVNN